MVVSSATTEEDINTKPLLEAHPSHPYPFQYLPHYQYHQYPFHYNNFYKPYYHRDYYLDLYNRSIPYDLKRPYVNINNEFWNKRKRVDGTGVAFHPDGSSSFVGSRTHGIGKRSADEPKPIVEKEAESRSASDLTPADDLFNPYYYYGHGYYPGYHHTYDRYYRPYFPHDLTDAEKLKYNNYWPYRYYPYHGLYPRADGYPYPVGDPRYYYWNHGQISSQLKEILKTKEVSVHPRGGVSYISRRIHGVGKRSAS